MPVARQLRCCRMHLGKICPLKCESQLTCSCAPKPCLGPTRRTMLSATRTEMSPAFCATQPDVLAVLFAMLLPASSRFCAAQGRPTQEILDRDVTYTFQAKSSCWNIQQHLLQ